MSLSSALFWSLSLALLDGRPTSVEPLAPIVHEVDLAAPPAEVWKVFSTGEGFRKLGPAQAEVDLRIGGLIRSRYDANGSLDDEGAIHNEILAFEPERMIAFKIHRPPKGFPYKDAWKSTWSVVTLTDLGDGRTHLRDAMLGFGDDEESKAMRAFFDRGNGWTIEKLRAGFDAAATTGLASRATRSANAAAHDPDPLAPIVLEEPVHGSIDDVWRAWTTAEGWKSFFGVVARVGSRPGEPFEIEFDPSVPAGRRGSEGCTVLASIPKEMFSFTWNAPPEFAHARAERTWVVVQLEAVSAATTRVRLRHLGFDGLAAAHPADAKEWQDVRAHFAQAWPMVLGALAAHFPEPNGGASAARK